MRTVHVSGIAVWEDEWHQEPLEDFLERLRKWKKELEGKGGFDHEICLGHQSFYMVAKRPDTIEEEARDKATAELGAKARKRARDNHDRNVAAELVRTRGLKWIEENGQPRQVEG